MQESKLDTVGFRISPQQEHLLAAGEPAAVVQCAARLNGSVDATRVRAAVEQLVQRHEILRTAFVRPAGMRVAQQMVAEQSPPAWTAEQSSASELLRDSDALAAVLAREAERGLDPERGPLLRARLIARGEEPGLLVLTALAVCADAASLLLALEEVGEYCENREPREEPIQYADYAEWRHELIGGAEPEAAEGRAFWRDHEQQPSEQLRPLLGRSQPVRPHAALRVPVKLESDLDEIQRAASTAGVTVSVFLEAAWHALIARLSGTSELLVAGWFDGRLQPDLARAVGPYAQPVPVRSRYSDDTSFAEVLDQLRRARAEAAGWQDYGSAAELEAITQRAGIGFAAVTIQPSTGAIADVVALNLAPAPLALALSARVSGDRVDLELGYDPEAFERQDVEELGWRFALLLSSALADPACRVARLAITDAEERGRIIAAAAGPEPAPGASTPIISGFEQQSRLTPDRLAVASAAGDLTYAELNAAANRLAHRLRELGAGPRSAIALCMERSSSMLTALLAILKAGGAYLPLNYEHPRARLAHQLSQAQVRIVLTEEHLEDRLPAFDGTVLAVDRDAAVIAGYPDTDLGDVPALDDPVYVMYTSGSTGTPKGVVVTHGNLANYAAYIAERIGREDPGAPEGLRFGVVSAISTDLGNTSIFPALVSGGCVHLVSLEASMDGQALVAELGARRLDVLKITPSHLDVLLSDERARDLLPRRWLVIGGEALSWEMVKRIRGWAPECRILNHYGPTEATIGCCTYEVSGSPRLDCATVPIGSAIGGVRAYVLDSRLEPLPPGWAGELCIAGAGVADGYVGDGPGGDGPFVSEPFPGARSARMYRTGDRVRQLRDGQLEFLGRLDEQLKIRGFRVEPGEIESALNLHQGVRHAAVVPEQDDQGQPRLVAYLVGTGQLTVEELSSFLGESLPSYMVPSKFATLDALPLTPSGKVDRRALAGLAEVLTRRQARYLAPRSPLEQTLVDIWAGLLGVERVGIEDDFFALGGHSLLAAQVVATVRSDFAVDLPLHSLFTFPTVASLASEIVTMMGESDEDETAELLAELEGLSDDEARRLLTDNQGSPELGQR